MLLSKKKLPESIEIVFSNVFFNAYVIIFFIKIALALAYFNNVVFNTFSCNHQKCMCRVGIPPTILKNVA